MRRWLLAVPLVLAVALVARLLVVWALRFTYPFDLEWMEGGMLLHALRLSRDLPLYPEPGREWIPYIYPPGYPSVVALLGVVAGIDYPIARATSLLGTFAAAAAIVKVVRDEGHVAWGLAGAAMFLGCYEASGAFYDIVRPDGLLMGLLAWSLALGLDRRRGMIEASGLLLAAAYATKHNAAAFGLPLLLGIGLRDGWRGAARFALWSAVPALAVTGVLQATSGGRFLQYVVGVPGSHELRGYRVWPGLPKEVGLTLPIASVLAFGALADRFRFPASWRAWYALAAGITMIAITSVMRAHTGGFVNVLIPLHWFLALAAAVGLARWDRTLPHLLPLWALLAAGQIAWQAVDVWRLRDAANWPDPLVPTAEDRAAGLAMIEELRHQPEPLWSPFAPWLAVEAGHLDPGPPLIALWDIDRKDGPLKAGVADVKLAIEDGWYATIVDGTRGVKYGSDVTYEKGPAFDVPSHVFMPRTGWRARPERLLYPKAPRPLR